MLAMLMLLLLLLLLIRLEGTISKCDWWQQMHQQAVIVYGCGPTDRKVNKIRWNTKTKLICCFCRCRSGILDAGYSLQSVVIVIVIVVVYLMCSRLGGWWCGIASHFISIHSFGCFLHSINPIRENMLDEMLLPFCIPSSIVPRLRRVPPYRFPFEQCGRRILGWLILGML